MLLHVIPASSLTLCCYQPSSLGLYNYNKFLKNHIQISTTPTPEPNPNPAISCRTPCICATGLYSAVLQCCKTRSTSSLTLQCNALLFSNAAIPERSRRTYCNNAIQHSTVLQCCNTRYDTSHILQ